MSTVPREEVPIPKLLCVDDSSMVRGLLKVVLSRVPIEFTAVASGEECLERLKIDRPDGILLDLHMSEMDGVETLRRIVADPATATIPVLMLTGDNDPAKLSEAESLGARGCVEKPFDHRELRRRVRDLLGMPEE